MSLAALRTVALVDAANVVVLALVSPGHGLAAALGYAPAAAATALVHAHPRRRRLARALCVGGLLPNTAGALLAARRSRALSWYLGVGGAVLGLGYLLALRR